MAGPALWANEPPIRDSIRVSAAVLLKGESATEPAFSGEWTKALRKKLPGSIALFLKPSQVIDSNNPAVRKAASEAMMLLGPGAPARALEDPQLLAQAVDAWVQMNFSPPDENYEPRPYAIDTRTLLPKASVLIKMGQADQPGRVRLRLALMRALGVPARSAWLRGEPAMQYWAEWIKDEEPRAAEMKSRRKGKAGSRAKEPAQPKGEWVLDETVFPGETAEAWSLDAGDLAPALWLPEQELAYSGSLEKAYFSLSETALATGALDYIRRNGSLPLSLTARALPPRKGPWLMLALHRAHFVTEGSMEALRPLELLLPYRPKLAGWGIQRRPIPESLETLATAFWTDRPDRARLRKNGEWTDEYKSPPPAYGMLHYASIDLRKPLQILDARLVAGHVLGKLLRRDSLAVRQGWDIRIEFPEDPSLTALSGKTDELGRFDIALDAKDLNCRWIKVSGGQGQFNASLWDSLVIGGLP